MNLSHFSFNSQTINFKLCTKGCILLLWFISLIKIWRRSLWGLKWASGLLWGHVVLCYLGDYVHVVEKKSMGAEMGLWPLMRPCRSLLPWRLHSCCSKSTNPSIFVILSFFVFPVCFFAYALLLCSPSSSLLLATNVCWELCAWFFTGSALSQKVSWV